MLAQSGPTPTPLINPGSFAPAKFGSLDAIINLILPTLLVGAGVLFLVMLIVAGFWFMNSDGQPEHLKKVKNLLTYSIIGIAIVLVSFLIVKLIGNMFTIETPF